MPQLNKNQVRSLIRNLMDDNGAKLWNSDTLDLLIEGTLDELWTDLMEQFPYIRWTEIVATATSPGYVDLSSANASFLRFYKILKVYRDGAQYSPASPSEISYSNGVVISAPPQTWTLFGDALWLFPLATSSVTVQYNSFPEPFTSLAAGPDPDDGVDDDLLVVPWPDGHHLAYIYDVASRAMEKGDREESSRLGKRAEVAMYRLKSKLRKFYPGPIVPTLTDSPINWGSE